MNAPGRRERGRRCPAALGTAALVLSWAVIAAPHRSTTAAPAAARALAAASPAAAVATVDSLLLGGERSIFYGGFEY